MPPWPSCFRCSLPAIALSTAVTRSTRTPCGARPTARGRALRTSIAAPAAESGIVERLQPVIGGEAAAVESLGPVFEIAGSGRRSRLGVGLAQRVPVTSARWFTTASSTGSCRRMRRDSPSCSENTRVPPGVSALALADGLQFASCRRRVRAFCSHAQGAICRFPSRKCDLLFTRALAQCLPVFRTHW